MQQRSVVDLADNSLGMADVVKREPRLMAAAKLIDEAIAEQLDAPPVDGVYREVGVVDLLERGDAVGVKAEAIQFVLNVLPHGVYAFGGRDNGQAVGSGEVVALMRSIALAERDGKPMPARAHTLTPVHRFTAAALGA